MPNLKASDLYQQYTDSISMDAEIYAEMRSNILLVSGDHYARQGSRFWNRIRDNEDLTKQQKLRLTKNHIRKITNDYVSVILSHSPATIVIPNNEDELQDQKTAEQNNSVLTYFKKTLNLREKTREKAEMYVQTGEVFSKTYFDPDAGEILGYMPVVDETGRIVMDQSGQIVFDQDSPIMSGQFVIENLFPADVFRPVECRNWEDAEYIGYRRMMSKKQLKLMIPEEDWAKAISSGEETFLIFNGEAGYATQKDKTTLVLETYYRPCAEYPRGYYYISTQNYVITEGELPFGIFPIAYKVFDKITTSIRGRSPIKQMRPYQIEINRAASAIATAQITLGDDRVVINQGSKITNGGQLPGVRAVSIAGAIGDVKIIPGRTGEQYVPYMMGQIEELYRVMGVADELATDKQGQLDPYALLYHSIKNRRKFVKYTEAFTDFCKKETEILLDLAKKYLNERTLIPMIGKSEMVNIAEFKNSEPNRYRISIEEVDADAETMLGKQLAMNHALQYVGPQLDKSDIGKIIRAMPFINKEESFDEFTIDYDNSKNEILMLERGQMPMINQYDNHGYIIRRITNRMKKSDFQFLPQPIKDLFKIALSKHEEIDAKQKEEILRAQKGWIPTDGYLVICDFYVSKENGKTERVRLPYNSIKWLMDQLKAQGTATEDLEKMNQGALADMSARLGGSMSPNANIPPQQQASGPGPDVTQGVY